MKGGGVVSAEKLFNPLGMDFGPVPLQDMFERTVLYG